MQPQPAVTPRPAMSFGSAPSVAATSASATTFELSVRLVHPVTAIETKNDVVSHGAPLGVTRYVLPCVCHTRARNLGCRSNYWSNLGDWIGGRQPSPPPPTSDPSVSGSGARAHAPVTEIGGIATFTEPVVGSVVVAVAVAMMAPLLKQVSARVAARVLGRVRHRLQQQLCRTMAQFLTMWASALRRSYPICWSWEQMTRLLSPPPLKKLLQCLLTRPMSLNP